MLDLILISIRTTIEVIGNYRYANVAMLPCRTWVFWCGISNVGNSGGKVYICRYAGVSGWLLQWWLLFIHTKSSQC